jgi:hypothetical protein
MSSIRCPQCNLVNSVVDSYCKRCSYPLSSSAQAAAMEQQTQLPNPSPPQWQQPYPNPNQQPYPNPMQPPMQQMPMQQMPPMQQPAFRCMNCGGSSLIVDRKVSTAGWVVFATMILFCFPLFWIGLLMKEDYRRCGTCGISFG